MAEAPKPDELPKVQTYKQQYDSPRMTFFLGNIESTASASPGEGHQKTAPPSSNMDRQSNTLLTATDNSDQSKLDVLGNSPSGEQKSVETVAPTLKPRANSDMYTTGMPNNKQMKKEAEPSKKEDDGEIKYIDEDVDDVSDGDSISVKVTFKENESRLLTSESSSTALPNQELHGLHSPSKEEIMSKFEEQEKSFREQFLSPSVLDLSAKREEELMARSPLPLCTGSPEVSTVLDRSLHYLVKVMERMSMLRKQNENLQKKCLFLEDTRYLLQLQNDILMSKDQNKSRTMFSQKIMHYFDLGMGHSSTSNIRTGSPVRTRWERLPSEGSDVVRSSTPQKGGKLQRSQSEGSLDLVDMDFTISSSTEHRSTSIQKTSTSREHIISRSDFHKKSRKLQQKWERVKKVFSGKPELGTKADTGAVSAEQLVRANTKRIQGKQRPPNLQNLPKHGDMLTRPEHRRMDSSPNLHDLPPTPNSVHSEPSTIHGVDEDSQFNSDYDMDINVPVLKRSHSAGSLASDNGSGSRRFLFDDHSLSEKECSIEKILFLRQEGRLDRRRSSPTISVHDYDEDFPSFEQARLLRSSGAKFFKSSSDVDLKSMKSVRHDTAAKAKAAWDRVKDIIHARKDSLKKGKPSLGHTSSDGEISPDGVHFERATFHLSDPEELLMARGPSTAKNAGTSVAGGTGPVRMRTMIAGGQTERHSPGTKQKRKSLAHVMLNSSPTDVAAFMGITDDFNKRMQEWEEKKRGGLVKANSFSCEMESHKPFDKNASTKFTEDFIKKMEQWEQMKGLSSPPMSPDPEKPKQKEIVRPAEKPVQMDTLAQGHPTLHNLSESFSKTVQEWERVKERRAQEGTSPGPEGRGRQRTVERSKSRERDRSRHKYEKEIQKIERKEWKIEREKQKLERMKLKLDMAMESSSGSEGFGDSTTYEYMIKQLNERDTNSRTVSSQQVETRVMASQHQESVVLPDESFHHRSLSTKEYKETKLHQRDRVLTQYESFDVADSPPDRSRFTAALADIQTVNREKSKEVNDNTNQVDLKRKESTGKLVRQIEDKEEHIKDLQYDIQQLTDRISLMDQEHHQKIESYKRQLRVANKLGQFSCKTYQIDNSLKELRNQVDMLIQAQDILVKEKQALEKKHQTSLLEHEESRRLLLDHIQTLQERLDQRGYVKNPTPRPAVTALCGLITQAQGQLNHLRHALDNRTQTIQELERHLLTHKVNNKLLEAGLRRQSLEIGYLRQQTRKKVIRRSKTFSGHEFFIRQDGTVELRQDRKIADHCKKYSLSKIPISPQVEDEPPDVINLDLHSNWLEVINRQLDQEEDPSPTKLTLTSSTSQTVMTLINCPYRTVNMPTVRDKVDHSTQSEHIVFEVASTQTIITEKAVESELEKLDLEVQDRRLDVVPIVATVTEVPVPTVRATCSIMPKPGILKSHLPRPKASDQRSFTPTTKTRKCSTGASSGTGSATSVDINDFKSDDGDSKRHSYQEWLSREPEFISMSAWRTASLDVPIGNEEFNLIGQEPLVSSTDDTCTDPGRTYHDPKLLSPDGSTVPQLPHSPVIRSKNLRKLKNTESKAPSNIGDARTWKATPPRRFIRHRKNMVERLSMGSMLCADDDTALPPVSDPRIRSKSDSAELQAACAIARDSSFKRKEEEKIARTGEHISRMQNLLEVRSFVGRSTSRSSSGVRNMISRYEEGNFVRGHVFRKSPSPSVPRFSVTSPQRLKTAAELLQDSMEQKESHIPFLLTEKSATIGTPREKLPSTSSDKENASTSSHPKGPIRQSAIDNGSPTIPTRSQIKPTLLALAISLRKDELQSGELHETTNALKDRTNDKSDTIAPSNDHAPGGESESLSKDNEGLSKPKRVPLSAITPPSNKRNIHKQHPEADLTAVAGTSSVKPESTMSKKDQENPRHMSKAGSFDSSKSAWSGEQDECQTIQFESVSVKQTKLSPNPETERKSRSISKGRFWPKGPHHLFDKKRTVSPSPARGAISSLCMHTMTVSVEDDSTDSLPAVVSKDTIPPSPGSDPGDKRSRRSKFLDSNWFQKPRGFFKVSKC